MRAIATQLEASEQSSSLEMVGLVQEADEYALTMPYRSPVQSIGRIIRGLVNLAKAVLRAFGIGKAASPAS